MEKTKDKSIKADLFLLITAVIWGLSFAITKNTLDYISPLYMLAIRFIIATIILSLIFFKRVKKTTTSDLKAGFLIGLFLFVAYATQTIGLKYTTASKQAFITGTNVVMVPFLYWAITKKKPDGYEIFSAFLCFIGIGILSFEGSLKMGLGDGLTLICAFFYACHIVAIGYFAKGHDPILLTIYQFMTAAILALIFAIAFEEPIETMSKVAVLSILYLAVFSTLVGFLIQNIAQKYTSSTHAAIILSMESVFGSIFSILMLKESFTLKIFIGCIAILISIITTETKWNFLRK